jgi:predicted Zn-dependent protease
MRKPILMLAAAAVALSPAVAQAPRYLNPRDVAEAQREHAAIVEEMGGAETGQRAAYVQSVGRRVGAYSGVADPGQALHFTALNSAVENAMSVPGGYVYVTRQLLTIMDDESQLGFALGHEVAHIAANHARARQAYAQRSNVWGVLGAIVGGIFGGSLGNAAAQAAQARSQLSTLSFSRDQEYQADLLASRYLVAAGYDPAGGPGILAALARSTAFEARLQGRTNRQTPEWASTHPLSQNRAQLVLANARAMGRLGTGIRNRDQFLAHLEGVYVDDDPAQGMIEGPTFTHPDLRIQFTVPPGYRMSNGTRAVTVAGSAGKAQFRQGPPNLDQAILYAFRELTDGQMQFAIPPAQRTTVNGMPAAFTTARVNGSSGVVDASVFAYQWDAQRVYYFVMLTPGGYGIQPFAGMVNSVRRITPAEAAAIRPRIIHVQTVSPAIQFNRWPAAWLTATLGSSGFCPLTALLQTLG